MLITTNLPTNLKFKFQFGAFVSSGFIALLLVVIGGLFRFAIV